jgi:hypothetical protein
MQQVFTISAIWTYILLDLGNILRKAKKSRELVENRDRNGNVPATLGLILEK